MCCLKIGAFRRAWWMTAGVMIIAVLAAGCGSRPASIASDRFSPSAAKRLSAHASAAWLAGSGIGPSRFGQPERPVLAELDAILGPPARPYWASVLDCGVDHVIAWPGLEAYFGSGRFVGYSYRGTHLRTTARLKVGDSVGQARQLYGNALRLSFEQGGAWFVRTSSGQLDGFTYGRSGNRTDIGPDSRIGTIEAGKVGCPALSP